MPDNHSRRQVLQSFWKAGATTFALATPVYLSGAAHSAEIKTAPVQKSPAVVVRGHPNARSFAAGYNGRYETVPDARIMCQTSQHVAAALNYVRSENLPFSIRSGGHCFAGLSQSNSVVIDVRNMNSIRVDKKQGTITAGAGATLGQAHRAAAQEGFLLSAGWCSDVGLSGQVLGGGIGFTSRFGGLLCDRLQEMTMVDAQGQIVHANKGANEDLLWASRGGGGSLGVLSEVVISLDEVLQTSSFSLVRRYSSDEGAKVFARWQKLSTEVDRSITSHCSLYGYPNNHIILIFTGQAVGNQAKLSAYLHELLGEKKQIKSNELVSGALLSVLEGQVLRSMKGSLPLHAKSHFLNDIMSVEACSELVEEFNQHPYGSVFVTFETLGGAVSEVGNAETAYPHRHAKFLVQSSVQPKNVDEQPVHLSGLKAVSRLLDKHASGGAYVNYRDRELSGWANAYWGENLPRLAAIKRKYDPENIFRHAQSIPLG